MTAAEFVQLSGLHESTAVRYTLLTLSEEPIMSEGDPAGFPVIHIDYDGKEVRRPWGNCALFGRKKTVWP